MDLQNDAEPEFAALRRQAGLTIEEAASITKSSVRATYRHDSGECSPSPLAIDALPKVVTLRKGDSPAAFSFIDLFAGIGGLRIGSRTLAASASSRASGTNIPTRPYLETP